MVNDRSPGQQLVPSARRRRDGRDGRSELSLEDLLRQSHARIERDESPAALPLLHEALDREPHCVPALLLMARCQLALDDAVQALEYARQARRRATGVQVDAARALFDRCADAASGDQLEALRTALREGRSVLAVTLADRLVAARPDDDGVANVHAYAYERAATSPVPATRARARAGRGRVRSLTPQALQATLTWLARDELDAGTEALEARDFVGAAAVLDRINRIDDRGAKAGYLQAKAMYGSVFTEMATPVPSGLDVAARNLSGAATLARRAAATPEFTSRARDLLTEIDKLTERVTEEIVVRPISRPYEALKKNYLTRTITEFEAATFRRSLAALAVRAQQAERRCRPGSVAARQLARIRAEIAYLQRQLRWV